TRIAVARLADRARVEQVAPGLEVEDRPLGGDAAGQLVAREGARGRRMAVADEDEGLVGRLKRPPGGLVAEHVLPDGVAGAPVEQIDAVPPHARRQSGEELARISARNSRESAARTVWVQRAAPAASPAKSWIESDPSTTRS